MKNLNTVLYVTDYSDNSRSALEFALELSKKAGAQLVVSHIFDIPTILDSPLRDDFADIEKDVVKTNLNKLEAFCKVQLDPTVDPQSIRYEAKENRSVVHGITAMIEECRADMVVMGTKGESRVHELIMGRTSKAVIAQATCPVLTIPYPSAYSSLKKILYATDFEEEDIEAIRILADFAPLFDAEIVVTHVSNTDEFMVDQEVFSGEEKMRWFKELVLERTEYPKIDFRLLLSNDIHQRLNDYVKDNDISLIAMLERRPEGIFYRWFHRDLVQRMEWHTSIPLLSFNETSLPHHISMAGKAQTAKNN